MNVTIPMWKLDVVMDDMLKLNVMSQKKHVHLKNKT